MVPMAFYQTFDLLFGERFVFVLADSTAYVGNIRRRYHEGVAVVLDALPSARSVFATVHAIIFEVVEQDHLFATVRKQDSHLVIHVIVGAGYAMTEKIFSHGKRNRSR